MDTHKRPAQPVLRLVRSPSQLGRAVNDRVKRALHLLHAHIDDAWTVASLAKRVGTSRPVLAREFRAALGVTPMRYLTRLRLSEAARLLAADNETGLARIAHHVGYRSEFAFNRAFKREFGCAPGGYRRARRGHTPVFRAAA